MEFTSTPLELVKAVPAPAFTDAWTFRQLSTEAEVRASATSKGDDALESGEASKMNVARYRRRFHTAAQLVHLDARLGWQAAKPVPAYIDASTYHERILEEAAPAPAETLSEVPTPLRRLNLLSPRLRSPATGHRSSSSYATPINGAGNRCVAAQPSGPVVARARPVMPRA